MKFELDHLGIAVRNLEESTALYEAVFGLSVDSFETLATHGLNVAFLSTGTEQEAAKLELLQARGGDSALSGFIEKSGPGLHHLALRVDNLDEAIHRLRGEGFQLIGEPQIGAGGRRCIFVHPRSTGGVLLELLQRQVKTKDSE